LIVPVTTVLSPASYLARANFFASSEDRTALR
jgi:hypothetical protein